MAASSTTLLDKTTASDAAPTSRPQALDGFDDYVHTAPGTMAGRYMRSFWHPVYLSDSLKPGFSHPVKVMSEEFTVYRGEGGRAHVVAGRCTHRGALMHTGWIQGDDIRCMYHGWKYDASGQCIEIPADHSRAHQNYRIRSVPTQEYIGLVFAYFGEGAPPPLPRYREFEGEGVIDAVRKVRLCNYFQDVENNVDPAHTPFTHSVSSYTRSGLTSVPEVVGEETEWGIAQYSKRAEGTRVSHHGMPTMINLKFQPEDEEGGWKDFMAWRVPVDDVSHINYLVSHARVSGAAADRVRQRLAERDALLASMPSATDIAQSVLRGDSRMQDHADHPDLLYIQDHVAQMSQGAIADRSQEHLARTDVLIVLLRRIWSREMRALAEGRPLKTWRRPPDMAPTNGIDQLR